jgi:hypothetical protein
MTYKYVQSIQNCIPETNHISNVCNVAAILNLQFMVHIMLLSMLSVLYFYISTSRIVCAEPNMAVFCSSFTSCYPGRHLRCFLND